MYYKNPFNYIGAKYKLLPQILPLFPDKIPILFDLFGGSGEVAFNAQADRVIYNEKTSRWLIFLTTWMISFLTRLMLSLSIGN